MANDIYMAIYAAINSIFHTFPCNGGERFRQVQTLGYLPRNALSLKITCYTHKM